MRGFWRHSASLLHACAAKNSWLPKVWRGLLILNLFTLAGASESKVGGASHSKLGRLTSRSKVLDVGASSGVLKL